MIKSNEKPTAKICCCAPQHKTNRRGYPHALVCFGWAMWVVLRCVLCWAHSSKTSSRLCDHLSLRRTGCRQLHALRGWMDTVKQVGSRVPAQGCMPARWWMSDVQPPRLQVHHKRRARPQENVPPCNPSAFCSCNPSRRKGECKECSPCKCGASDTRN